jgi:hypothetical protein
VVPPTSAVIVYLLTDNIGLQGLGSDQTLGSGITFKLFGTLLRKWGLNTGVGADREATSYQEIKYLKHYKVENSATSNTVRLRVPYSPFGSSDDIQAGFLRDYPISFSYEPTESTEPAAP